MGVQLELWVWVFIKNDIQTLLHKITHVKLVTWAAWNENAIKTQWEKLGTYFILFYFILLALPWRIQKKQRQQKNTVDMQTKY